ncbi:hypothetical protein BCR44DRAFT_1247419 [Catenaria anguillulae PL171]|uniref:Secreted protein n=1 Tax=Catenaria anguillulae PL171 TaxID=765915 RepID=A0A1Y2HXY3_9FUNG|nr:hypothetical protein BCR44DRAFT_1247419 [Catenaria anguillulae PL171]
MSAYLNAIQLRLCWVTLLLRFVHAINVKNISQMFMHYSSIKTRGGFAEALSRPQNKTTGAGFEPARAEHIGFQVQRLRPLGHPALSVWRRCDDPGNPQRWERAQLSHTSCKHCLSLASDSS